MTPLDTNHSNQTLAVPVPRSGPGEGQMLHFPAGHAGAMVLAGDGPAGPPGLSAAPTLSGLIHALRRRWQLGVGLALAAALATVLAVFLFLPPRYLVETRFNVAAGVPMPLFGQNADAQGEFVIFKEYQKAQVRSPLVLAAALNEKVANGREARDLPVVRAQGNGALEWMERSLKADFKVAPEIMSVWLSGDDPEGLADLVNAIGAAYLKENDDRDKARRKERLDLYRENLKVKEQELSNLRVSFNGKRRPGETKAQLGKGRQLVQAQQDLSAVKVLLQNLQIRQGDLDSDIAEFQAKMTLLQKQPMPADQVDEALRTDSPTQAMQKQLEEIDFKMADYGIRYPKATADVYIAKEQAKRDVLLGSLDQRRKAVLPEIEARYRGKIKAELTEKIEAAQRRRGVTVGQIKGLNEQIESLNRLIANLDPDSMNDPPDIAHLKDEIKSTEAAVDRIRQTILTLGVEGASSRVSLQQRASPPTEKDYSRQAKMAGAGGVSMFGLVLFGVAFIEFRTRRISMTDEVSRGLGLSVVGALPAVVARTRKAATRDGGARELAQQAQLQEAIDGVRTMLLHAARSEELRVIMVTSACGGEGKTSVASQLAASLARAWRKTLLIDGDLRSPAAHKLFDLPRDPGFCEVLRGEVAVEDAIQPAPVSRLSVLPAGHWDSQAGQALAQDDVAALFEKLKSQYDFIVVDSSPVLPVADAMLLGQHADGVLFSILRDVSRAPEVYAAQQRLAPLGIRTLGAVVIGMSNDLSSRAQQYAAS
jgi:polysaccharide biosynthesis transport protein